MRLRLTALLAAATLLSLNITCTKPPNSGPTITLSTSPAVAGCAYGLQTPSGNLTGTTSTSQTSVTMHYAGTGAGFAGATCPGYQPFTQAVTLTGQTMTVTIGPLVAIVPPPPPPPPAAPTVSITCNGASTGCSIAYQATATIAWTSVNATSCSVGASNALSGSLTTPVLTASTSYTASCKGAGGTASASVAVTIAAPPPAVDAVTISGVPAGVACTFVLAPTGQPSVTSTTSPIDYTGPQTPATVMATCAGYQPFTSPSFVLAGASQTVSIGPLVSSTPPVAPTASILCNGAASCAVASAATASITWTSANATSCSVSPGGSTGTSGSLTTPALTASTSYSLSCTGAGGSASATTAITVTSAPQPGASTEPLLQATNFTYAGGFRVPQAPNNPFQFGGSSMTYWAAHNSLLVGDMSGNGVGEISIPALVNSPDITTYNIATLLQPVTNVLGQPSPYGVDGNTGNGVGIAGLLVTSAGLLANVEDSYDATQSQSKSLFVTGQNFAALPTVVGPLQIGTTSAGGSTAGITSHWLVPIPPEFQAAFGGDTLAGNCCMSIIARTSQGPSASVFTVANVGQVNPIPATPVVGYYNGNDTLGVWSGPGTALFTMATRLAGAIWVPGTRSLLFYGIIGTAGNNCYGLATSDPINSFPNYPQTAPQVQVPNEAPNIYCYDPLHSGTHGEFAYPYRNMVWAYDANDLLAVKLGQKNPWDIVPYATWTVTLPTEPTAGVENLGGVSFDPATGRVYLTEMGFDPGGSGVCPAPCAAPMSEPVVHVFTVTLPASIGGQPSTQSSKETPSCP